MFVCGFDLFLILAVHRNWVVCLMMNYLLFLLPNRLGSLLVGHEEGMYMYYTIGMILMYWVCLECVTGKVSCANVPACQSVGLFCHALAIHGLKID